MMVVRRSLLVTVALAVLALAVAAFAFRSELERVALTAAVGIAAWRVLLAHAGIRRVRRRRRASWPEWIEALSFAWFAFGFRGANRPRRERGLGRRGVFVLPADRPPARRPVDGPGDEIPF